MYYELYIDVLFFTNFMMDSLLLLSVKKIMKNTAPCFRVFLGGILGSLLTCVTVLLPLLGVVKIFLLYVVINVLMLCTGLRIRKITELCRAAVCLYTVAFLLGGILQALSPYVQAGSVFFAAAVLAYYVLIGCWKFFTRLGNMQRKLCAVTLYTNTGVYEVQGLADTGNTLTDPVSKEPVSVIGEELARQIFGKDSKGVRLIPFHSVSGQGLLAVRRIEKMCIHLKEEFWIPGPILGICSGQISENEEYQIILNTDLITGGTENGCKSGSTTTV